MTRLFRWIANSVRWQRQSGERAGCSLLRLVGVMLWWGDEDAPRWWNICAAGRRILWYRSRQSSCQCPGCPRKYPTWWASGMCAQCCYEDCDHEEAA